MKRYALNVAYSEKGKNKQYTDGQSKHMLITHCGSREVGFLARGLDVGLRREAGGKVCGCGSKVG